MTAKARRTEGEEEARIKAHKARSARQNKAQAGSPRPPRLRSPRKKKPAKQAAPRQKPLVKKAHQARSGGYPAASLPFCADRRHRAASVPAFRQRARILMLAAPPLRPVPSAPLRFAARGAADRKTRKEPKYEQLEKRRPHRVPYPCRAVRALAHHCSADLAARLTQPPTAAPPRAKPRRGLNRPRLPQASPSGALRIAPILQGGARFFHCFAFRCFVFAFRCFAVSLLLFPRFLFPPVMHITQFCFFKIGFTALRR